jgi:branched-chain amino acid aminotransferase
MHVYLNSGIVSGEDALVSVFDHGFLYGDGVFETLRAYGGRVFMLEEHLKRLERSASLIGLEIPKGPQAIRAAVHETLEANLLEDAYVRVSVTRGFGPPGLDPSLCETPTFVVIAGQSAVYPEEYYSEGVILMIPATRRNASDALDPRIKSHNFLNNILAKTEAIRKNAYDALMLNHEGMLAECTVSNVFFAKKGTLFTPSVACGILDGITRGVIIALARGAGIEVNEGRFTLEDIIGADEVFITNTSVEVMPVSMVDQQAFGKGEITRDMHDRYMRKVREATGD